MARTTVQPGSQSFSGADYQVTILLDSGAKVLESFQTLSISTHTDRPPVRRCGERTPTNYANGPRTIAGTMVFLLTGVDPLVEFLQQEQELGDLIGGKPQYRKVFLESVPPFNILIEGNNEVPFYNGRSELEMLSTKMALKGVTIVENAITLSVHDMFTELMYTYTAIDIIPFMKNDTLKEIYNGLQPDLDMRSLSTVDDLYESMLNDWKGV